MKKLFLLIFIVFQSINVLSQNYTFQTNAYFVSKLQSIKEIQCDTLKLNGTNKFGNALKNLGFKKEDRFLIRLPNIPEFQTSFLGGVKIGAIPIPSSVMFRAHEIEYRIKDSGSKAVITTSKYVNAGNLISP